MDLRDLLIMLVVGGLITYGVGRLLIRAFFAAKRRHQQQIIRDFIRGEEPS